VKIGFRQSFAKDLAGVNHHQRQGAGRGGFSRKMKVHVSRNTTHGKGQIEAQAYFFAPFTLRPAPCTVFNTGSTIKCAKVLCVPIVY